MNDLNIYEYSSFNLFLNDWVKDKKQKSNYSLGRLVNDLNLNSIAEISNILKGRRNVSHSILERFIGHLELSQNEVFYIKLIAELDRNKNNDFISTVLTEKASQYKVNVTQAIAQ